MTLDHGTQTELPGQRPATRIGRNVIFPGGRVVRLSLWEWPLFALGLRKYLKERA